MDTFRGFVTVLVLLLTLLLVIKASTRLPLLYAKLLLLLFIGPGLSFSNIVIVTILFDKLDEKNKKEPHI